MSDGPRFSPTMLRSPPPPRNVWILVRRAPRLAPALVWFVWSIRDAGTKRFFDALGSCVLVMADGKVGALVVSWHSGLDGTHGSMRHATAVTTVSCCQGGRGGSKVVRISSVQEDADFVSASRRFEQAMASQSFREFCAEKEATVSDPHERKVWQFMQIIFEKNARNQLLAHLGFDGEVVAR